MMMQPKIDEIIRSKRKTLQLTITRDARLVVRAPLRLPMKTIRQFVKEKSGWIEKNRAAVLQRINEPNGKKYVNGEVFYFLGVPYQFTISKEQPFISFRNGLLLFPEAFMASPCAALEKWYKKEANAYIGQRLAVLSGAMGIDCETSGITSARTRWGSCSSKNRLNFTWRLIQAEPGVVDYVIVHELCHVRIKNHSKAFWETVAHFCPDYGALRRWLRDHQFLMNT